MLVTRRSIKQKVHGGFQIPTWCLILSNGKVTIIKVCHISSAIYDLTLHLNVLVRFGGATRSNKLHLGSWIVIGLLRCNDIDLFTLQSNWQWNITIFYIGNTSSNRCSFSVMLVLGGVPFVVKSVGFHQRLGNIWWNFLMWLVFKTLAGLFHIRILLPQVYWDFDKPL